VISIKLKIMKKLGITIFAASLMIIGCKTNGEKEAQVEDENNVETTRTASDSEEMKYADASLSQDAYAINTEDINVNPETRDKVMSWTALNTFHTTIQNLKEAPEDEIQEYGDRLKMEAGNLKNTIPASMMTEEIEEDIKDINEEIVDLQKIFDEPGVDENRISSQVEELVEAYDDFNEEVKETMVQMSKNGEVKTIKRDTLAPNGNS
tara:strand:- start:2498 stop:3121 length:624 start_codon:yes stop_codon:yes gene_type:complete